MSFYVVIHRVMAKHYAIIFPQFKHLSVYVYVSGSICWKKYLCNIRLLHLANLMLCLNSSSFQLLDFKRFLQAVFTTSSSSSSSMNCCIHWIAPGNMYCQILLVSFRKPLLIKMSKSSKMHRNNNWKGTGCLVLVFRCKAQKSAPLIPR